MAPKVNCSAGKLASVVSYLQRSKVCHSLKDLEKHLPQVASINSMQVKDYIQTLTDESRVSVEKIGSGNWYWSFASDAKQSRVKALAEATSAHAKATAAVEDLRQKNLELAASREEEEEMLDIGDGETREELTARRAIIEADIKTLQTQLAAYSHSDPTELERKCRQAKEMLAQAETYTDEIQSMESWFVKEMGRDVLANLAVSFYGDEYDTEECALRELDL